MFSLPGIVTKGFDELEVLAWTGAGDLEKHASTLAAIYRLSNRATKRHGVPLHGFLRNRPKTRMATLRACQKPTFLASNCRTRVSGTRLESGEPLEFVLAVPGRRYSEFVELLQPFHEQHCAAATEETVWSELPWRNLRLVVAHNPHVASEAQALRQEKIKALEDQAAAWVGKLDAQDTGVKARGKKLSDSGAKARLYHVIKEARLAHIFRVDLKNAGVPQLI